MPVYDFECPRCGIFETIADYDEVFLQCESCHGKARRIISFGKVNTANEDAPWIRSVLEVVDKQGKEPETKAFLRNPTRSNMKAWMKARGLRHMEPGEEKVKMPDPIEAGRERRLKYMWEQHQKRNRLEVRG